MSKDDFEAVAYKVLSYLYACLKAGAVPSEAKALEMSRVLAEDAKSRTAGGRAAKRPRTYRNQAASRTGAAFFMPAAAGETI